MAWRRLLDLVGDDAAKAMPDLLAALDGPDAELRYPARMVIETLGERAASAAPFFADRFLHGPCRFRDTESRTLYALGAEGRRVLRRAALLGDPSIAVPARDRIGEGNAHMDELLFEALHAPGENARLRAAERLFAERDRRWVEKSLIAVFSDDSPFTRHRVLCALGVGGRERRHAHPRAIHLSTLYGAEISTTVLDALMEAYGSENAPWVAVDLVKAVGEADYSGSLADRLPRAQEFLRAAAEGNSSEDVREAAAEGLARLTALR